MARPLRIEYPGAVYHVMARGNQGRPIFKDDQDRKRFLETLQESCQKTGWLIQAYVLMAAEFHSSGRKVPKSFYRVHSVIRGANRPEKTYPSHPSQAR